jgi:hypothetical protein
MLTIGMPGGKEIIVPEMLQVALEEYVRANVIEATTPKTKRTNEVLASSRGIGALHLMPFMPS